MLILLLYGIHMLAPPQPLPNVLRNPYAMASLSSCITITVCLLPAATINGRWVPGVVRLYHTALSQLVIVA